MLYRGTLLHMLIMVLMFVFSKFLSFVFLGGVIWSQNLKFSKLTKIWYRDQLLYTYCDFNVYFFKIFVSHIFLGKFGLKIRSCPNGLKFGTGVHLLYAYYDFTVDFFKSFVIHIVLGKFDVLLLNWNLAFVYIINIIC